METVTADTAVMKAIAQGVDIPLTAVRSPLWRPSLKEPLQSLTKTMAAEFRQGLVLPLPAQVVHNTNHWVPVKGEPKKNGDVGLISVVCHLKNCYQVPWFQPDTCWSIRNRCVTSV